MDSLNSVMVEGKATNTAKLHITSSGNKVATFNIATVRTYKVGEDTRKEISYFLIEAWGKVAEEVNSNVKEDSTVRVVGRLKQDRWRAESGENLARVKIMAESIMFMDMKEGE